MSDTLQRNLLSQEEIDFLQNELTEDDQVIDTVDPYQTENTVELHVEGFGFSNSLLQRIGMADQIKLQADFERFCLLFPVQIQASVHGGFNMVLSSPEIIDHDGRARNWRMHKQTEFQLLHHDSNSPLELLDISTTGFAISIDSNTAPETLSIELRSKQGEIEKLNAEKVRTRKDGGVAYQLVGMDTNQRIALRSLLYNAYRTCYPEAPLPDGLDEFEI